MDVKHKNVKESENKKKQQKNEQMLLITASHAIQQN